MTGVGVILSDVGPFKGKQEFVLSTGKINVVEAPNAAGKSSFIKGLAACLSLPTRTRLPNDIARRLGLLPNNSDEKNPLVNINSEHAVVELISSNHFRRLEAYSHGYPKVAPEGDERFLITGLLLRESEIIKRLDEGSDDFSWLVDSLSLSSNYEEVRKVVEEYHVATRDRIEKLREDQRSITALVTKIEELRKERDRIKNKRKELEAQLNEVLAFDPKVIDEINKLTRERDQIEAAIEDYRQQITSAEADIRRAEKDLRSQRGRLSELEEALNQVHARLNKLPSRKEIEDAESEARELRRSVIPNLKEDVGRLRAELALLEQAEKWIVQDSMSIPCPLCEKVQAKPIGSIPIKNFKKVLTETREKCRDIEGKLAQAIRNAEDLEAKRPDSERKRKELEDQRKKFSSEYASLKKSLQEAQRTLEDKTPVLTSLQRDLELKQNEILEVRNRLKQLQQQYGGEKRGRLLTELRQTENELGRIESEIGTLDNEIMTKENVEVLGKMMKIDQAISIYDKWFGILSQLILHIDEAIIQQRKGAAQSFNKHVARLIKEMEFQGLQVWIDENTYRLKVQRKTGNNLADQPIPSLSASERHALGAVLTLAAKEAYAPDIPFFLVDEVVLDFDTKRLTAFVNYLKETSLNKGHVVVISRLGGQKFRVYTTEEI